MLVSPQNSCIEAITPKVIDQAPLLSRNSDKLGKASGEVLSFLAFWVFLVLHLKLQKGFIFIVVAYLFRSLLLLSLFF